MGSDTARKEAQRLLVASGVDPAQANAKSGETFVVELERYLERKRSALRPRSFVETTRYLQVRCKALHGLSLNEIDRRAVAVTLAEIETGSGPVARNRARAYLSA